MKQYRIKESDLAKIYTVNKRYTKESLIKLLKKNQFTLEKDAWVRVEPKWNHKVANLIGLFIQYDLIDMRVKD